jgi:hypothetical protein
VVANGDNAYTAQYTDFSYLTALVTYSWLFPVPVYRSSWDRTKSWRSAP